MSKIETMVREQLAKFALVGSKVSPEFSMLSLENTRELIRLIDEARAEVQRLKASRDQYGTANEGMLKRIETLDAEVQRLKAERDENVQLREVLAAETARADDNFNACERQRKTVADALAEVQRQRTVIAGLREALAMARRQPCWRDGSEGARAIDAALAAAADVTAATKETT